MMKQPKPTFLETAIALSEQEKERAFSRMKGRLSKKVLQGTISDETAIAIQLEKEEKSLQEWRERIAEMRQRDKTKG
jgi:hypothetical protein